MQTDLWVFIIARCRTISVRDTNQRQKPCFCFPIASALKYLSNCCEAKVSMSPQMKKSCFSPQHAHHLIFRRQQQSTFSYSHLSHFKAFIISVKQSASKAEDSFFQFSTLQKKINITIPYNIFFYKPFAEILLKREEREKRM